MFKQIIYFCLLFFFNVNLFGDTELLQTYMHDFYEGEDTAKVHILRKAVSDNAVNKSLEPLVEYALQYVLANYAYADNYNDLNSMILISINGLQKNSSNKNLELLWNIFLEYPASEIKTDIIIALGRLGKGNSSITGKINNYLNNLNAIYALVETVDYTIVSALISALIGLDDTSSYPVLINVLSSCYPEVIYYEALGALDFINGNLNQFLIEVIKTGSPDEKFAALEAGIDSKRLNIAERGHLAETALELALDTANYNALSLLRYAAVSFLTSIKWTRANNLAVRHYYNTLLEFQENSNHRNRLIEAVAFLGAAGNSEAALALGLQLGLINDRKEKSGSFDTGITLAIIQALGLIGDNATFSHLLRAVNLSYNEIITPAAREAIDRLKW